MKNKLIVAILCIALAFALAACATAPTPEPDYGLLGAGQEDAQEDTQDNGEQEEPRRGGEVLSIPDGMSVATLDDYAIPATTYAYFFLVYRSSLEHNAMMTGVGADMAAFWDFEQGGVTIRQMLLEEAMNSSKEYTALYRAAVAQGIEIDAGEAARAQEQIDNLLAELDGDEQRFVEFFALTPDQMGEAMRVISVGARFFAEELNAIEVTQEDMRAVFDADPDAFSQVTVRHVLFMSNDSMSAQEQAQANAQAQDILRRVRAGEDIGDLAAEYSACPSGANNGELIFGRGEMVSEFEQWSFAAGQGDTDVIKTDFGYHVVQKMSAAGFEGADLEAIERQVRNRMFFEIHADIADMIASDRWVYDQDFIDRLSAMLD